MSQRVQMIILGILLVVLVAVYFFNKGSADSVGSVAAADIQFTPLNVQEPELRLDLLDKIQKSTYGSGSHRNVFVFGAAPVVITPQELAHQRELEHGPIGPQKPVIPPVQVSAQFFGTASMPVSGRHVAFFQSGEDVIVVAEGDTFLTRFRLVHIGNDSADVEEISSGRHASVPLVPPVVDQAVNQSPNQPPGETPSQDVAQ
jgi:hypothetical protein